MNNQKFQIRLIGAILVLILLVGCTSQPATPAVSPTFPPPPQQSPQPPPPPAPIQPVQSTQASLFKFIQTIRVTPDDEFLGGGFARINYVPVTDRFVVTFASSFSKPLGKCKDAGYVYKEYTTDMQATGKYGSFLCEGADVGSVMVDNTYYFVAMSRQSDKIGWRLLKIDMTNWKTLIDTFYPLDFPREGDGDPMVAYVNGQIDVSSAYTESGTPPGLETPIGTYGTHHQLFSTDLQFQSKKILTDPPQVNGSYMVYVDGVYYLVTANLYAGDIEVAKYDKDWKYLGGKTLIKQAHFSTGLVYDGQRFYVAYTDTSQRTTPGFFPVYLNIHLAAFDLDWNLVEDIAVTKYAITDNMQPGRPWVILHGNRLYVSYDLDVMDPINRTEEKKSQAIVSIYELNPSP